MTPTELKDKICSMVEGAFVVDGRSKKVVMKTAGVSFRQCKSWLTTQYIIPFMNEPQLLIDPPSLYAHIIDEPVWQEFVRSRMSSEFQKLRREQQDRRKRSKYTHNMSRRGYANLAEDMKKGSFEEQDFGQANMWKKARTKKDGGHINEDVQQVASEIDEILDKAPNEESPNDALTQALGTPEYDGQVRGVGGFITPTVYFHQAKPRKSNKVDTTQQIIDENEAFCKRIREFEQNVQSIPTSEHGSCSKSKVQEKEKVLENEVKEKKGIATSVPSVSLTSKKKVKSSRPMTKEVEVTSGPSNLPIQLKYILRYAERKVSKYVFVDPSLISAGHSTREIRARNLCSRLMTSKQDQLVVAPYNPGDHWSLVIISPYDDVVYHLDSLRTSSRDDIKYVTNMALTIFQSQKNLKKTRKTTFWKAVKCPLQVGTVECGYYVMRYMREILSKDTSIITDAIDTRNSYSQLELDEVRVEWTEFLSRHPSTEAAVASVCKPSPSVAPASTPSLEADLTRITLRDLQPNPTSRACLRRVRADPSLQAEPVPARLAEPIRLPLSRQSAPIPSTYFGAQALQPRPWVSRLKTCAAWESVLLLLGLIEQISRSAGPRCSPGTPKIRLSFLWERMLHVEAEVGAKASWRATRSDRGEP
ncbi:uncharacterized protein E6C27_scaffold191G00530 [Cucumis melo var. makuwa]|uniref:Ubiquitin-like protease family profile domain-containing protein n=1 Tax=Cucumis melo var. makuwa TaxID=1194695 RepID=A0A5A7SZN2_CUCMM|nr:uncharacterized protein E6C27_scaffold191G00530 [Cucumis melo var. makuwa]